MEARNVEGTRRRAALRGEEAVARWRLRTGAWTARVYAVVAAVPALSALFWSGPATMVIVVYSIVVAAVIVAISFGVARGNRAAAAALLVLFVLGRLFAVVSYGARGAYQGVLVSLVIAFGLVQGVWGAWSLRRIQRERAEQEVAG